MPYPNEHACRLIDPDTERDRVRRSTQKMKGKDVGVIYYVRGGKAEMQAVRFPTEGWSASEARAVCRDLEGTFEAAKPETQGAKSMAIFLSDLRRHEVRFESEGDLQMIRGLPLMKPGTWNGKEYAVEDLQAIAARFAEAKTADGFEPAVLPYHKFDADGRPIPADVRETLAYLSDVRFDAEADLLLADCRVVDEDMVRGIQQGKFRYLSVELDPNYYSPGLQKELGPTLVGTAWVSYPAVRSMPAWDLVINAQEYGGPMPAEEKGGEATMSIMNRLRALVGTTLSDKEVESLEQEIEALSAENPQAKPADKPAPEKPATDQTAAVLAQMQTQIAASDARAATLEAQMRHQNAERIVDELCRAGHLPPAQKGRALQLVELLAASEAKVAVLAQDAEGKELKAECSALQAFTDLIIGSGPKVMTSDGNVVLFSEAHNPAVDEETAAAAAATKRAEEIRAAHAAEKKGG